MIKIPAERAAAISYNPDCDRATKSDTEWLQAPENGSAITPIASKINLLGSIPDTLYDPKAIHARISQTQDRAAIASVLTPPRTPIETKLAETFAELLGITEVGVDDSFFALGGHSLLAMQVLSRANSLFNVALEPTLLFTSNFTVAELAAAVVKEQLREANPPDIAKLLQNLSELNEHQARAEMDLPTHIGKASPR